MKLYSFAASPNAIKVWAVVHHIGLKVESVEIEFGENGTMRTDEYGALNPNRRMPTLVDGDFTLWESNAIMQYLAHKSGRRDLWPEEPRAQADVSRWMCWQLAHWLPSVHPFLFENVVKQMFNMGPPDAEKLKEGAELFARHGAILNAHLEKREWICGEEPTLADFAIGSALPYAQAGGFPWDDFHHIQAWYRRLESVEGWKEACPQLSPA